MMTSLISESAKLEKELAFTFTPDGSVMSEVATGFKDELGSNAVRMPRLSSEHFEFHTHPSVGPTQAGFSLPDIICAGASKECVGSFVGYQDQDGSKGLVFIYQRNPELQAFCKREMDKIGKELGMVVFSATVMNKVGRIPGITAKVTKNLISRVDAISRKEATAEQYIKNFAKFGRFTAQGTVEWRGTSKREAGGSCDYTIGINNLKSEDTTGSGRTRLMKRTPSNQP